MAERLIINTVPVNVPRKHIDDGTDCWCQPVVYRLCPECDGAAGEEPPVACWRCADSLYSGMVGATEEDLQCPDTSLVVVHNDVDSPEA